MKKYTRPVVEVAEQLAEGVYMLSGDNEVDLAQVLDAASMEKTADQNSNASDMTNPVTEATDGVSGSAIQEGGAAAATPGAVTAAEGELQASGSSDDPQNDDTDENTDHDAGLMNEDGTLQRAMLVQCNSKYMDGNWQAPMTGSFGDGMKGCKEVLGCKGCPADKTYGCGLQEPNADSLYYHDLGSLMPEWEATGKTPSSNPYGF